VKLTVETRGSDEEQTAGGHDRAAVIFAAGMAKSSPNQLGKLAEGFFLTIAPVLR
jgi:hypothetical protein